MIATQVKASAPPEVAIWAMESMPMTAAMVSRMMSRRPRARCSRAPSSEPVVSAVVAATSGAAGPDGAGRG